MKHSIACLALLQQASAACYKHVSCTSCIAETNEATSCLWYQSPDLDGIGTCVAGKPEFSEPRPGQDQLAVDAYGTWSMVVPFTGETRYFTVPEIDQVSDDSCYTERCVQSGMCEPGYLAVQNEPCYSDNVFPEWRTLLCCRQQRNINGYLRGYEAENGIIQGNLWFASCCTVCFPGQVIKDCNAYNAGYCEDCPIGRFNLYTYAGSECEPCQPCEAGRVRSRCGPSTQGTCNECEAGKEYKLKGLEGSYTDPCLPCEACPSGHVRVGCGGASPGYCAPCQGGSFFGSPFCRNCFTCFPLDRIRHGCGGQQQGVCTECSKGRYEDVSEACLECATCSGLANSTELVEGLQLTGAWARIGCGGLAAGRCVRMAAALELQDSPRCPSSVDADALCEGSQVAARWTMQGISSRMLEATYGDCTAAIGLCLSGFFRVKLMQRKVDAFDGVEIAELGDFFSAELEHLSAADDANAVMLKRGLQLPSGLPEASGYFLRIFLYDAGGSCCSAVSTNPLFADSEDFSLEGKELLVKEALELTSEDISAGQWQAAYDRVSNTCATTFTQSTWIACETAKALQLGLPVGQRSLVPMPLLHSAGSSEVAAMGAAFSVNEAGDRLVDIEQIYNAIVDKIPQNATVWQHLMQPLFVGQSLVGSVGLLANTTTTSTMFPMFTAQEAKNHLEMLKSGAQELSTAAQTLYNQWASEISGTAQLLPPKLQNLQEIDRLTGESTKNASFDVVRMAQAITWKLSHELNDMKNSATMSLEEKETKMGQLLQRTGSMALMLLGTWGNSWYHGIDWRLKCQVRSGDELQWPPLMTGSPLGGAQPPPGAIPVEESKQRIWKNFEEVAEACFSYADELLVAISTRTTTTSSTVAATTTTEDSGSRRLTFSAKSLDRVLPTVRKMVQEVVDFTEQVIEPLTRDGALLLAGDLPNISMPGTGSCSVRGWCLSFATEFFDKDVILPDVWEGFGAQAVRPWVDPRVEDLRLKDASEEVLALVWGRMRVLEEILLEVVDLRHAQQQPSIGSDVEVSSKKLAEHLARVLLWSEAPQNVTIVSDRPDALWHGQELQRLHHFLTAARRSAALLARRRLGRMEALAAWVSRQRDDGYFLGPAGWSWRQPWTPWSARQPGSSSGAFFAANAAARNKLQQSIDDAELLATTSGSQAYLRIDATAINRPVAFAGLQKSGSTILRIRAPADKPHLMMHAEAKAFLLSPQSLVSPLQPGAETGEAPSGAFSEEHLELRLKRLAGAFDVTNTAVEPTMEGQLPFVTRFPRRDCQVLPEVFAERHPEIVPAALLPLDGFWVLTARDGTSARMLNVEEDTVIRLLFQLDVPSGTPPWRLLEDTTDVLYKLSEDGVCQNLQPIFGTWPETSTFPPTTRTTLYTVTATTRALFPTTTRNPMVVIPAEDEPLVLAPRVTTVPPRALPKEPWTPPVWLWAGLFVVFLVAAGVGVRCYIKRRRRKIREVLPEELEEGKGKKDDKVAPTILTQESRDGAALRGAADAKSGDNPYLAMAKKNAKKQASKKGSSWEISDTPRDKDEDDAWSEASTPEGSEESGGSSRSRSGSDSDSQGALSPRTALAQKALQQHMQQFSPDQLVANALGDHARRLSESSDDQIAASALQAHAALAEGDRGFSKTSKATAQFGPKPRLSKGSSGTSIEQVEESEERQPQKASSKESRHQSSKQSSKQSKQSRESRSSREQ